MLKTLVLLLLLANLAFYAWTQGWLDSVVGVHARGDHEPERMKRQVNPELVKVLTAQAPASAAAAPLVCLEAGPFAEAETAPAEAALAAALPSGGWLNMRAEKPAVWAVYMGRYADPEAKKRKAEELTHLKVPFEEVLGVPQFEPGLSLGKFDTRAAADAALVQLTQRGVRSATVIELSKASTTHMLRFYSANATLAAKLTALKNAALGRGFGPCANP